MKVINMSLLVFTAYFFTISFTVQANPDQNAVSQSSHEKHKANTLALELNNGNKWIVDEDMKLFILEAEKILNEYIKNSSSDYNRLAVQLKKKNIDLINSCSMQGKGHEELHKWLHPHIELLADLEDAKDEAVEIISDLKKSFETYHHYFQ